MLNEQERADKALNAKVAVEKELDSQEKELRDFRETYRKLETTLKVINLAIHCTYECFF